MSDLTEAALMDAMYEIKALQKPVAIRPKKIIYRPSDIQFIAHCRGVSYEDVVEEITRLVAATNGGGDE